MRLWVLKLGEVQGFPHSSVGKESAYNAGDPGLGRSAEEGIGYPLQYFWASLVTQLVKNPPVILEIWVRSLGWEDPPEKGKATHSSILKSKGLQSQTTERLSLSLLAMGLPRWH